MKNANAILDEYQRTASASADAAQSLPLAVFHDEHVFQQECQRIFRQDWVFICSAQEISESGDYFAFRLAGENIAIIRGKDDELRALSNICRHRATPLLDEGFGNVDKLIICPYHAWAYNDKGALKGAPLVNDPHFSKEDHCLPQFHLQQWQGLLFINLSNDPQPLQQRTGALDEYLALFDLPRFTSGIRGKTEHWQANWKLVLENAMESYHLFKVHQQTLEKTTPTKKSYYLAGDYQWTLTGGEITDTGSRIMKWLSGNTPEIFGHYILLSLPPSFVGILTYDSFDWLQVMPVDSENSWVRSGGISTTDKYHKGYAIESFTQAFFAEDKIICERVQQGMRSQLSQGGKLTSLERILVDFHQYLANRLFASNTDAFYENTEMTKLLKK